MSTRPSPLAPLLRLAAGQDTADAPTTRTPRRHKPVRGTHLGHAPADVRAALFARAVAEMSDGRGVEVGDV